MRAIIRVAFGVKGGETIKSAIERKRIHIIRLLDKRRISKKEFRKMLKYVGLKRGDTIIIHCGWRGCYSLDMSPEEVIEIFRDIVGENGLILMPAYGESADYLDIRKTPSHAGALSEIFRKMDGVVRSRQPHFSMCAIGKGANEVCDGHDRCVYSFDKCSPYYKAIKKYDAKVILMGLDKHSVKTPVYHLAAVEAIKNSKKYEAIYDTNEFGKVIDKDGKIINVRYLVRNKNYINNDKIFLKLLLDIHPCAVKKYGFNITVIDGQRLYEHVLDFCQNNGDIYRKVISVI